MNLVSFLEENARRFSWRKCIISEKRGLSFRALNREANSLAFGLKEKLGIKKQDKVAILLDNCPEYIIALFAILKVGAVCVPLNIFLIYDELKYILKDCGVKLLISSSSYMNILRKTSKQRQKELKELENIILIDKKEKGFLYWSDVLIQEQPENISFPIDNQDVAFLIYTSGTTGFPKGVMLSHRNLCSNVIASIQALEVGCRDRFLLILPMFHSFTLTVCILIPIYIGARIVIIKSVRPFQKVLRSILFNRVTIIVGIPHLFDILKNFTIPPILQMLLRVKICISGAAPLNTETLRLFKERFKKISLLEGYGLTEASPVVSINPWKGVRKPGSIGLPLPGVEVKAVDEDESEVSCREIGELIVRGPNVMKGYFNQPEETKRTIRGGWLFTGDMAKIDSDGYIYIVGRKKEMILTHGMNVYPSEIEQVLRRHPQIKEAAVAGKKDRTKGEIPVAFVVPKEGANLADSDIIAFCKGKLANYKIPRLVEFRKELPKTPTGKVLKRKLV